MRKYILILAVLLLVIPVSIAQDQILSNSADWQDVYSTLMYGKLLGVPTNFLTSTQHSTLILFSIPTTRQHVQVITSSSPYVVGYEDILLGRGYSEAEELVFSNVNLELARLLEDINDFIIVDSSYGYNALSAAPYAAQARYYVLFADELNIGQITSFLEDRGVDNLMILGQVDREVRQNLAQFDPEIINAGDRFDNNIEMVKKYLEIKDTRQAILSNGEFIEAGLMSGADPVLFIGRANVPDRVRTFIQNSDIDVGILIGNELIGAATTIRRQLGISVFVKFAQGSRAPEGPISQVEDLDRFIMPSYDLDISVESAAYNTATGQLEITYSNNVDLAAYIKSTITVIPYEGTQITRGDENAIFIDGGDIKTVTYDIDVPEGGANASIFAIYGESANSLENELQETLIIDFVDVRDNSKINITDLRYDPSEERFLVKIKNTGDVTAFVDIELVDLTINEEMITIGGDELAEIDAGKTTDIPVSVEVQEEDIEDNEIITVRARYGERSLALIKETQAEFGYSEVKTDYVYYVLLAAIIILILLIIRKRKKKEK